MIYIESMEPGCVVLTDSPKFMEGHRACVDARAVVGILAILDGAEMSESRDGFRISSGDGGVAVSFDGGEERVLDWREQRLLRHALEGACLQLARTRT